MLRKYTTCQFFHLEFQSIFYVIIISRQSSCLILNKNLCNLNRSIVPTRLVQRYNLQPFVSKITISQTGYQYTKMYIEKGKNTKCSQHLLVSFMDVTLPRVKDNWRTPYWAFHFKFIWTSTLVSWKVGGLWYKKFYQNSRSEKNITQWPAIEHHQYLRSLWLR